MPKTQLHPMHGSNHLHGISSQSFGSHGPPAQPTTQTPPIAKNVSSRICLKDQQDGRKTARRSFKSICFNGVPKPLRTDVKDGVSKEMAVETTTIPFNGQPGGDHEPEETYFNTADGRTFKIRNYTTRILRDRIQNDMPRTLVQDERYPFVPCDGVRNFHHNSPYDINTVFVNLTIAITDNLQSRIHGVEQVEGVAWTNVVFIEIRWAWLSLPLALLMGSLVLLCATTCKARKSQLPAWKPSALATLLHGPREETLRFIAANISQSEIEAISEK